MAGRRNVSDGELFLDHFFGSGELDGNEPVETGRVESDEEGSTGRGVAFRNPENGRSQLSGKAPRRKRVTFRNPETGDLKVYSYSGVGFFFLGVFYLLYKGELRLAVRLLLAMLGVFALWACASQLPFVGLVFDPEYGVGSLLLFLAMLAVQLWFLIMNPVWLLKDLFTSGYAPESEEGWGSLGYGGMITERQLESYKDAHAHRPAEGPRPGYACLMGAVRACGLREGDDYRRLEGPVEGVRLRLSPKDDALASLFGALGAEDGEGAASEILSCDPSEEVRQMSFGRCRVRWVRTPRGVANLEVFERPDEWGLPAPQGPKRNVRRGEPEVVGALCGDGATA